MDTTTHFDDMLVERSISRDWVDRTVSDPDRIEDRSEGNRHYLKQIPEFGNRWLRVVVDITSEPPCAITVFFDRRIER